jgi:hypothetical protein
MLALQPFFGGLRTVPPMTLRQTNANIATSSSHYHKHKHRHVAIEASHHALLSLQGVL